MNITKQFKRKIRIITYIQYILPFILLLITKSARISLIIFSTYGLVFLYYYYFKRGWIIGIAWGTAFMHKTKKSWIIFYTLIYLFIILLGISLT